MNDVIQAKTIIIFDDDEDILSICTYILEEEGYNVISHTDTSDIFIKVRSIRPDLILMDNWLKRDDGTIAITNLKKQVDLADIPVILFSGNTDIAALALTAGSDAYLAKPFDLHELLRLVASLIV